MKCSGCGGEFDVSYMTGLGNQYLCADCSDPEWEEHIDECNGCDGFAGCFGCPFYRE
jgi:hypothetical protein